MSIWDFQTMNSFGTEYFWLFSGFSCSAGDFCGHASKPHHLTARCWQTVASEEFNKFWTWDIKVQIAFLQLWVNQCCSSPPPIAVVSGSVEYVDQFTYLNMLIDFVIVIIDEQWTMPVSCVEVDWNQFFSFSRNRKYSYVLGPKPKLSIQFQPKPKLLT